MKALVKKSQVASATVIPRRILVGLDPGDLSDHAIRAGLELSRLYEGRLEIVHAVGSAMWGWNTLEDARAIAAGTDLATRAREAALARVSQAFGADARNVDALSVLRVEEGLPATVILERARTTSADLIVLGALRRRPIVDFGSTARAVLSGSKCALWVQPCPYRPIRKILVPIDNSPASLSALATACELARRTSARVQALHCFDVDVILASYAWGEFTRAVQFDEVVRRNEREFVESMQRFDWGEVPHETTFVEGSAADRILELAESADLIAMGTHGRRGLSAALLGSVAYAVFKRTTKPVLAVRGPHGAFEG